MSTYLPKTKADKSVLFVLTKLNLLKTGLLLAIYSLCILFSNNAFAANTNNLAMSGNTVAAANLCQGNLKMPVVSFSLADASTGGSGGTAPVISGYSFTTTGTYAATG